MTAIVGIAIMAYIIAKITGYKGKTEPTKLTTEERKAQAMVNLRY